MFLLEPNRTQFDLQWRMFGTPVRVHPLFWLMAAILGWSFQNAFGFAYVLLWIACVFLSVLLHELGHVWMGRLFGTNGHIVLYSFGGLAIGSNALTNRWQRIAVLLAGPLIQFLPLALAWYLDRHFAGIFGPDFHVTPTGKMVWVGLFMLIQINLYWPLLNLLPIYPLDGGQISRELLDWFRPGQGLRLALRLSLAVAVVIALNTLLGMNQDPPHSLIPFLPVGDQFTVFMFGLLAVNNWLELQQTRPSARTWERERTSYEPERAPWEQDPDFWKK